MTHHVAATIDGAVLDQTLDGAMRWTPLLAPVLTCGVCSTELPIRLVDVTGLGDTKPRTIESPGPCPNWLTDERHYW